LSQLVSNKTRDKDIPATNFFDRLGFTAPTVLGDYQATQKSYAHGPSSLGERWERKLIIFSGFAVRSQTQFTKLNMV
jgi:hypothetical protein